MDTVSAPVRATLGPDAVLCLSTPAMAETAAATTIHFFKNRQYACWDVLTDQMLPGYPRAIDAAWPGLLDVHPGAAMRGALHVPEWGPQIYFLFEGHTHAVVWDMQRRMVEARRQPLEPLLPGSLPAGNIAPVYAELPDGRRVIYGFSGFDYTRWTVGSAPPVAEDAGFPHKIAADWKDGLVLAPRAGIYVEWPNRSTAHSNRKIYFFMGDLYLRWDVPSHTRNYRLDVLAGWKGWPAFA